MKRALTILAASIALAGCGPSTLLAALPQDSTPQGAAGWTTSQVTPTSSRAVEPCLIERKAGGLAIAYVRNKLGDHHVYFTTSLDGSSWSTPVVVARGALSDDSPALYEDEAGKLHLVFASNSAMRFALYEATSTDGITWSDAQALPADLEGSYHPAVAALQDGAMAMSYETIGGSLRFLTRSKTGTWSKAITVDEGVEPNLLALGDGTVLMSFNTTDHLACRLRSTDGTWGSQQEVSETAGAETPWLSKDAAGDVYLSYADQSSGTRKLVERKRQGTSWAAADSLTTGSTQDTHPSAIFTRSGEHVLAWAFSSDVLPGGIALLRRSR